MSIVNFNSTTPAAPGGNANVTFQQSGDNVSAYYSTSGGGGVSTLGTAVFSATGGTISGLVVAGNISGVSRTGTGQYVVTLTGSPTNYIAQLTVGDTVNIVSAQIDPVASYTSSGFTVQAIAAASTVYDPGLVFITVIG